MTSYQERIPARSQILSGSNEGGFGAALSTDTRQSVRGAQGDGAHAPSRSAMPPILTPDSCTWQLTHHIDGALSSGTVTYSHSEAVITGVNCWQPCTESGVVQINSTAN